jgi:hypothetical protein
LICSATLAPAALASAGWTGFATPSRNIVCNGSYSRIDCVVFSASPTCQKTWTVKGAGRASAHCYFADIGTDVPVLPYGQSVSRAGMRCFASRRGLTCTNRVHHGFFVSRKAQRIF